MLTERILMVDDEPNVLLAFKRQFRHEFSIQSALDPTRALELLERQGPFAVVVSDMRMPGMDGIRFLSLVRELAPDATRIMLTGTADLQTAVEAVSEGHVFRFLTKPCRAAALGEALEAGIRQHRLVTGERELLERTLWGTVQVLTDILSLTSPMAFGRASRVRPLVRELADELGLADGWQIEVAAMLSQLGCVTLPEDTVQRLYDGQRLSPDERRMYAAHPRAGRELIAHIPRLRNIAYAIGAQDGRPDTPLDLPDDADREWVSVASRILRAALDYDLLVSAGRGGSNAFAEMEGRIATYDSKVLEALRRVLGVTAGLDASLVYVHDLQPGMVLDEDVVSVDHVLVLPRGRELTPALLARLENFASTIRAAQQVRVVERPPPEEAESAFEFADEPNDAAGDAA